MIEAVLLADVDHSFFSMLLPLCRCLAALGVKRWPPHTGGLQATLVADVHHAYLSMLLAVTHPAVCCTSH